MKKNNDEALEICKYISTYISDYISSHLTSSDNTFRSLEMALTLYIEYLESVHNITPNNLSCTCFENK